MILEKHINIQLKLESKYYIVGPVLTYLLTTFSLFIDQKQVNDSASQIALETGMKRQLARQADKKELEHAAKLAEKAAARAAKKPKKEVVENVEL